MDKIHSRRHGTAYEIMKTCYVWNYPYSTQLAELLIDHWDAIKNNLVMIDRLSPNDIFVAEIFCMFTQIRGQS